MDFFAEAAARIEDDDSIAPLFTKAMADISAKLATMSMNDDYKPYVNVSGEAARGLFFYFLFVPVANLLRHS